MVRKAEQPRSYVTYGIKDPRTGYFIYVGQTVDFEKRKRAHLRLRRNGPYNYGAGFENIKTRMYDLLSSGLIPEFQILEVCSDEAASLASETTWVKQLKDENHPLLNRWRGHRVHIRKPSLAGSAPYIPQPSRGTT